jgi:GTP-binding protein EngB required for normal cell division
MNEVNLNIDELQDFVDHIITNNRHLQSEGKNPVAVEVVGESGIGKTTSIMDMTKKHGLDFVKLNLAQIEELGDLVGFPIKQFQMWQEQNGKKIGKWVDEIAVKDHSTLGFQTTGKSRMSYSAPEWIADKKQGGVLLLDDWNRADVRFIQACMELVDRQTYISWTLPKDWHIILTANPDNGDYMVNSVDTAQKTRYITANLKFDINVWARWAEENDIDTRCINFLLLHPELVTQETNARSISTFFNSISSIKKFEDQLPLVQMIGEGSVGNEFASMFTTFINNKLDKLVTPKEIVTGPEEVLEQVTECIGKDDNYRADIASLLATRIANFSVAFSKTDTVTQKMQERLITLCTKDYFANDLKYLVVRTIFNGNKQKFNKMMMNPSIIKMAIK